jgi:predicted small secreted protein
MRSRRYSYLLTSLVLLLGALALAGCGVNTPAQAQPGAASDIQPSAQAEPGAITDILPTPPPMPTGAPLPPTPTPLPAPATGPQTAGTATLAQADFNGTADLKGWTVVDAPDDLSGLSVWKIDSGTLKQVSDSDGIPGMYQTALLTGDASWSDYAVSVAGYNGGNDEMGVVARAGDKGYYVFRVLPAPSAGPRWVLSRFDAAKREFTMIASANGAGFAPKRWYTLSLRVQGDHLQAFVDGQPAIDAHDATLATGRAGVYGFAEGDLAFDNFTVQALSATGR